MLGLDFVLARCARNASETGACSWGDGHANRANREPPHHSSTETEEPSSANKVLGVLNIDLANRVIEHLTGVATGSDA